MASTTEADVQENKPADESTDDVETSDKKPQPVDEVDYKVKFSESSREAQRLLDENKALNEEKQQLQPIIDTVWENPEILSQVQNAYTRKTDPTYQDTAVPQIGPITDRIVENKVREAVTPLTKQLEEEQRMRVQESVSEFNQRHPDAIEGTATWTQILEWLPAMRAKGLPLKQGLEKAYEIVTIDKAKASGKLEAVKGLFEKQQAAASAGSSAADSKTRSEDVEMTSEERKVAASLGIKQEIYAKNKRK